MKKFILVFAIISAIIYLSGLCSAAEYNSTNNVIYECGNITQNGTYTMNTSIMNGSLIPQSNSFYGRPVCLNILNSSVVLNCNSKLISNITLNLTAIYSNSTNNLSIKNCYFVFNQSFSSSSIGIFLRDVTNSTVINNTINGSEYGLLLESETNLVNATNNSCYGVDTCFVINSYSNTIFNNYVLGGKLSSITGDSNIFRNNIVIVPSDPAVFISNAMDNLFYYENYTAYSGGFQSFRSTNNSVYHSNFIATAPYYNSPKTVSLYGTQENNMNFINCTYNDSLVSITSDSGWITKKWFVTFNVTNSTGPMANISVIGTSILGSTEFSVTTNASGNYNQKLEVTEYLVNKTNMYNYSNYTISINYSGYGLNTFSRNINSNQLLNLQISDKEAPNVTLVTPNDTVSVTGSSYDINFTLNTTDTVSEIANCSFIVSGSYYSNTSAITKSALNSQVISLSAGSYTAYASCTDTNNNVGNSNSVLITVTAPSAGTTGSPGGGGSSGGSGSESSTYTITEAQLASGYSKELAKSDKIKFTIKNESHSVTLNSLTDSQINVNVSSTPQQKIISLGTVAKFELTGDKIYDLSVKYQSYNATSKKSKLTILKISDPVELTPSTPAQSNPPDKNTDQNKQPDNTPDTGKTTSSDIKSASPLIIIIGVVIILAVIAIVGLYFINQKKSKKK